MLPMFRRKSSEPSEDAGEFLRRHSSEISGTLCVFGDWFGRPMDNWHSVTGYETKEDYLRLSFNEGETLEVWGARGLRKEGRGIVIQGARRVRWEWFYYGRPQLPENRFFREHVVNGGVVEATTNALWHSPDFKPSLLEPAVSIQ